jgi:hypothetical protein
VGWRELRATRADRPVYAASGERKRVYVTALEQAEELWSAASSVGEVARPIVLYYALIQALQAWVAGTRSGTDWRSPAGHGLRLDDPPSAATSPTLSDIRVLDHGNGYIQHIGKALSSPTLPTAVTLSALVCSLHFTGTFIGDDPDPTALKGRVLPGNLAELGLTEPIAKVCVRVTRIPPKVWDDPASAAPPHAPIRALLRNYPAMTEPPDKIVRVDTPEPTLLAAWNHGDIEVITRCICPYPELRDERDRDAAIAPLVSTNEAPLHPLVTWLAVLYSMSMLARYHPERWAAMIDPDASRDAARIRDVFELAHNIIPWYIINQLHSFKHTPTRTP